MLVSDEVDEVSQLKVLNNATRFNTQGISFTIAPTMKCNFACPYCFEEGVRYNTMTQTIENETIEFIKNFTYKILLLVFVGMVENHYWALKISKELLTNCLKMNL